MADLTRKEQLELEQHEARMADILGRKTKLQKKTKKQLADLEDKINKLKEKQNKLGEDEADLVKLYINIIVLRCDTTINN